MRLFAAFILFLMAGIGPAMAHKAPSVQQFDRHGVSGQWGAVAQPAAISGTKRERRAKRRQTKPKPRHVATVSQVQHDLAPLVEKARALIGKTAAQLGLPRSLWCADFICMIAPEACKRVSNPRWARDYAELPRIGACQIGAIAVLARGRGGHIGVVSDCTARGPKIVSGNHGRRVGEGVYPQRRVLAYVSAG